MSNFENVTSCELDRAVQKMTLSASGWRGVFNVEENEQSESETLSCKFVFVSYFAAIAFSNFLLKHYPHVKEIVLARDARPTGENIEKIVFAAFKENARKNKVRVKSRAIGVACIPEVISYAASRDVAFFYISASHNPIGYNGFKFGLGKYGVLEREQAMQVICEFKRLVQEESLRPIVNIIEDALGIPVEKIEIKKAKEEACQAYTNHIKIVASSTSSPSEASVFFDMLKAQIKKSFSYKPIYMVCDFNGSARAKGIDAKLLKQLGIKFVPFNDVAGKIAHEIIPEGKNLQPLCEALQVLYDKKKGKGIFFGYMPDCDGDRGNIVYVDDDGKAQIIKSQEVFVLATIAEVCHAKQRKEVKNFAVVANGPTSMLLEEVGKHLGFTVFRAEVGEANVVNLARSKSTEGYDVRIFGEGSNGGCIIPPSLVRDPLCTIFALLKFFLLQLDVCELGVCVAPISSFSYLIKSIPHYQTTPVAETRAILHTNIEHVKVFRKALQQVFLNEWKARRLSLFERYDFASYKAFSYVGTETVEVTSDFSAKTEGGFKIVFYNTQGEASAFIWMRQSGTEPVFRLMADVKEGLEEDEKALVLWEKEIIELAKKETAL